MSHNNRTTQRFACCWLIVLTAVALLTWTVGTRSPSAQAADLAGKPPTKTPTPTLSPSPTSTPPSGIPGGFRTSGARILNPSSGEFIIAGVNWFGFETRDAVAHGLWAQDYQFLINKVKEYGFNTIRIPYSDAMWRTNPIPNNVTACPECIGKHSRDIMALIVNYAGSIGLHVIIDNHRSDKGNSAQANGLWYTSTYLESVWIEDWLSVQRWAHGIPQTYGSADTLTVNYYASDGFPIILGYDLRNEPHTPSRTAYLDGATWGSGDGIDPQVNPNPNPFAPACVATSTCHDWRLAAERAGDKLFGDAAANGWDYSLIFVEGIGQYPADGGTPADGPYDATWWGGDLQGVNGNSTNPGAPVVLNAGGDASGLGPAVNNKVVYSPHDYGPDEYVQQWFNSTTCYKSGCGSSSLADVWKKYWAYINLPGGVNPVWAGHASYPWENTGHTGYSQAPIYVGEFGTPSAEADLYSTTRGSQGQWFTDLENFVQSSYNRTTANDPGFALTSLQWTYWALNANNTYQILASDWASLDNPNKIYTHLCSIEQPPIGVTCTNTLPAPF